MNDGNGSFSEGLKPSTSWGGPPRVETKRGVREFSQIWDFEVIKMAFAKEQG